VRSISQRSQRIAKTTTPASLKPLVAHVAHPAGAAADEIGMNANPDAGSTATGCALFPEGNRATTAWLVSSMIARTGVQGDAALQAPPPPALPLAVHRLPAL
jgi:hypothetical protein